MLLEGEHVYVTVMQTLPLKDKLSVKRACRLPIIIINSPKNINYLSLNA